MKYSFVIPTYNNKVLLKNTLAALNYQPGHGHYEVVVVDDGSTDNTGDFIQGVNHNYPLRYFYLDRCADSSRSRTRNYGWRNAVGEIVIFIDSDIVVKPDYLQELDRCFAMDPDIAVIGNRLLLDEPTAYDDIITGNFYQKYGFDRLQMDRLEYRYFLYETTSYNINAIMLPWTQFYSCNVAVPKKWLEITGGFDENFKGWGMEDIELGYALYAQKVQLIINSKLEVYHQHHGERNDLVVKPELVPRYDQNIEYFLAKHPEAIPMRRKFAFQFLKGELKDDKMFIEIGNRYIGIDFKDKSKLDPMKNLLLSSISRPKTILVVNDYVEDTDLDIWFQLPKENGKIIARYYPMSRRLDRQMMMDYLKTEKERQRMEA